MSLRLITVIHTDWIIHRNLYSIRWSTHFCLSVTWVMVFVITSLYLYSASLSCIFYWFSSLDRMKIPDKRNELHQCFIRALLHAWKNAYFFPPYDFYIVSLIYSTWCSSGMFGGARVWPMRLFVPNYLPMTGYYKHDENYFKLWRTVYLES